MSNPFKTEKEKIYERSIAASKMLAETASLTGISEEMLFAACARYIGNKNTPVGGLVRFVIDVAADQYLAEEFYQHYPELLEMLEQSGCDNTEILFQSYLHTHPLILSCKEQDCNGTIIGGCPKMTCDTCGREYYMIIDGVSTLMCDHCVAAELGECSEHSRNIRRKIYAV